MNKISVLVADDSSIYRDVLSKAVENTGVADVKFLASDGQMTIDWLKKETVEFVLLDVFMPKMDGIEALKRIKKDYPGIEVIMITSDNLYSAELTMEALNNGAIDFIIKPPNADHQKSVDIIRAHLQKLFTQLRFKKLRTIAGNKSKEIKLRGFRKENVIENNSVKIFDPSKFDNVDLILIAASTGGPSALEKIFKGFESDFNKPVLVVQHMPPKFTRSLADSLNRKCKLRVKEGCDNDLVQKGQIIIAPGGFHMLIEHEGSDFRIKTQTTSYVNGVRPAADILFSSVANLLQNRNILVVILTGMGSDGKKGVLQLKQKCNCYCITQSERTCVVYGMPKSVCESDLSDEMVDIEDISRRIQEISKGNGA